MVGKKLSGKADQLTLPSEHALGVAISRANEMKCADYADFVQTVTHSQLGNSVNSKRLRGIPNSIIIQTKLRYLPMIKDLRVL